MNSFDGWINVYKPTKITSFDVIRKIKKKFNILKMGHTGTLDPSAEGVLPIAINKTTKLISLINNKIKNYEFEIKWGEETTTDDKEGKITGISNNIPSRENIEEALKNFIGDIMQKPPKVSAVKINGKRAYELARLKKHVTLPKRQVQIKKFVLDQFIDINHASFFVECGKGTYIRSLAMDFSQKLKTFGFVQNLRRTRVGPFSEKNALKLENLDSPINARYYLYPAHKVLDHLPSINLTKTQAEYFISGRCLEIEVMNNQLDFDISGNVSDNKNFISSTFYNDRLIALVRKSDDKLYPIRVFNLES